MNILAGSLRTALALTSILTIGVAAGQPQDMQLPTGWRVVKEIEVPKSQLSSFSARLGAEITSIRNVIFDVGGSAAQLNTVECRSEKQARAVIDQLAQSKGSCMGLKLNGREIQELYCKDNGIARQAIAFFDLRPRSVNYEVSFDAAPIAGCDYMALNRLFNLFLAANSGEPNQQQAAEKEISGLIGKFEFSDSLRLRRFGQGGRETKYSFDLAPVESKKDGDTMVFRFEDLPRRFGVPFVKVSASVNSQGFAKTKTEPAGPAATAANRHFPSSNPSIQSLSARIVEGATSPEEKIEAIMRWASDTNNLRFGGDIVGSRYGVEQVLRQGFGHCWDFSDTVITLCRASGVPCRQVAGWLAGRGNAGGHVWLEVWLEQTGWQAIDPTSTEGCGSEYIPYVTSEDGEFPFAYLSEVKITFDPQW